MQGALSVAIFFLPTGSPDPTAERRPAGQIGMTMFERLHAEDREYGLSQVVIEIISSGKAAVYCCFKRK